MAKSKIKAQHYRSSVKGRKPAATDMDYGELAINYNHEDPSIIIKGDDNTLIEFNPDRPHFIGEVDPSQPMAAAIKPLVKKGAIIQIKCGAGGSTLHSDWNSLNHLYTKNGRIDSMLCYYDGTNWGQLNKPYDNAYDQYVLALTQKYEPEWVNDVYSMYVTSSGLVSSGTKFRVKDLYFETTIDMTRREWIDWCESEGLNNRDQDVLYGVVTSDRFQSFTLGDLLGPPKVKASSRGLTQTGDLKLQFESINHLTTSDLAIDKDRTTDLVEGRLYRIRVRAGDDRVRLNTFGKAYQYVYFTGVYEYHDGVLMPYGTSDVPATYRGSWTKDPATVLPRLPGESENSDEISMRGLCQGSIAIFENQSTIPGDQVSSHITNPTWQPHADWVNYGFPATLVAETPYICTAPGILKEKTNPSTGFTDKGRKYKPLAMAIHTLPDLP